MRPSETRFLWVTTFGLHLVLFTTLPYHADGKHVVGSSLSYGTATDEGVSEEDFQTSRNASRLEKQLGSFDSVTESVTATVFAAVKNLNISLHEETISNVNGIITFFKGTVLDKPTVCNISKDVNLEHLIRVPVTVALSKPPERKTSSESLSEIFAHLAKEVLMDNFTLDVDGFKFIAQGIKEKSKNDTKDFITEHAWCTPGAVTTYINEEFTVNDYYGNLTDIEMFVNETGMTYQAGDFRLEVLLQTEDMHVTMSRLAHTCQRPLKCPDSAIFVADGAIILQNHSIWYSNRTYNRREYYPNSRTKSIEICGDPKLSTVHPKNWLLGFNSSQVYGKLPITSVIFISTSLFCLVFTLIIHAIFEDLRTLPGWNLINIMVAMVIAQTALLLNNELREKYLCYAIGIITHYAFLVQFFSANVIAWDIFSKFGRTGLGSLTLGRNKPIAKRVLQNMAYSYLFSAVFLAVAVILDNMDLKSWAAGYADLCWIAGRRVNLICFALPLLMITIANSVLIVITLRRMRTHKKSVKVLVSGKRQNRSRKEAVRYMMNMSVQEFTWILWIVFGLARGIEDGKDPNFLSGYEELVSEFLLAEASQGLIIFLSFGINPLVRKRIRNMYSHCRPKGCEKCGKRFCACAVKRSTPACTLQPLEISLESSSQKCTVSSLATDCAERPD